MNAKEQQPNLVLRTKIKSILQIYSGEKVNDLIYLAARDYAIAKVEEQRILAATEFNRQMKLANHEPINYPHVATHFFDAHMKYPIF